MSTPTAGTSATLMTLKIMVAAMMGAPVLVCLAMWFVLAPFADVDDTQPWTSLAAVVLLAVVMAVVINAIGYRATPLPPGTPETEAAARSRNAYQTGLFLRIALAEVPMLVSLALAFRTLSGGIYVALLGAAATIVLMATHAWPSARSLDRVAANLESAGTRSYLRESLGLPPR